MKRLIFLVILAGLVAGGYFLHQRGIVRIPILEKDEVATTTRISGNVEIRDARLEFIEREIVATVLVDEGAKVEAGEVLATLRSDRLQAELAEAKARRDAQAEVLRMLENGSRPEEVEQARAEVEAARARVEKMKSDLRRFESATPVGASSERELDAARSAFEVATQEVEVRKLGLALAEKGPREEEIAGARATLAALGARIRLIETRIADCVLRAPGAGIVRSRNIEPGEMAEMGRVAFTIALNERKWVRAYVSEPDLGKVHPGQEVRIESDSFPDRPFAGTIGFISPVAEFTPKSVETEDLRSKLVYEIRVWVEDPDDGLRLGMPVTVDLG